MGRTGWNMMKGLTKEHSCATYGHGQQYEDWLGEGRAWGWVEAEKGRKSGNCNSINNENKISKINNMTHIIQDYKFNSIHCDCSKIFRDLKNSTGYICK